MPSHKLALEPDFLVPIEAEKIGDDYLDPALALKAYDKIYSLDIKEQAKLERNLLGDICENSKKIEETVDDILYWDENKNILYVEAIAVFVKPSELVRFRNDLPTALRVASFACPVCGCKKWTPRNIDAKVVVDEKGEKWKCFSIIFACRFCLSKGRITERRIRILGFKYALIKFGRGLKDFLDHIKKVKISGDLQNQKGSAEIEFEDRKVMLKHCPLL